LSNLFNYLVEAGYLSRNPFALKRGRSATARAIHDERLLEKDTIDYLFWWLESLPAETVREKQHAERALWIVSLYYYTAARLREIPAARMADIKLIRGNWWFRVMGKGRKKVWCRCRKRCWRLFSAIAVFWGCLPALSWRNHALGMQCLRQAQSDQCGILA
jgi:integrase